MGTRSLTVVQERWTGDEEPTEVMVMYRQMDGYPTCHGQELADFLAPLTMVNGMGDERQIANGMGCLAAQIVQHFKNGPGGIYLYASGVRDCGEDYVYTVSMDTERPGSGPLRLSVSTRDGQTIYDGHPRGFDGKVIETNLSKEEDE